MTAFLFATLLSPLAVVAILSPIAAHNAGQSSPTAAIDEGQRLFAIHCSSCHGPSGHGDGIRSSALQVRPPDLAQIAARNGGKFVTARIERIIDGRDLMVAHGTMEMPVWGDAFKRREGLTEQEIRSRIEAIVRYLASIQARSS